MFSPSALPLGAHKKDRNTQAETDVEDTQKICNGKGSSVAAKEPLHSTYTAFNHHGTRSHTLGWWPLSYVWNCLPPYNHHTIPILAQIQDITMSVASDGLIVAVGLNLQLCSLHQGQGTASPRCSLTAMWELMHSNALNTKWSWKFLRRQFLQNNMLTFQVMKSKGGRDQWLTHWTTYQSHLWRLNNWISTSAPKAHTRQYSAKFYQTVCNSAFLTYSPYEKPANPTPWSQGKEIVTFKQQFFCLILYWVLISNSVRYTTWYSF